MLKYIVLLFLFNFAYGNEYKCNVNYFYKEEWRNQQRIKQEIQRISYCERIQMRNKENEQRFIKVN